MQFTGRERSRLARARECGYLNALCRTPEKIIEAHSYWCWRLRVPLVWFERKSPCSKYGRVHLDLFATGHVLTARGRESLAEIAGANAISPDTVLWDRLPAARLEEVAYRAFRIATRLGNYELRPRQTVHEVTAAAKLLPWRIRIPA